MFDPREGLIWLVSTSKNIFKYVITFMTIFGMVCIFFLLQIRQYMCLYSQFPACVECMTFICYWAYYNTYTHLHYQNRARPFVLLNVSAWRIIVCILLLDFTQWLVQWGWSRKVLGKNTFIAVMCSSSKHWRHACWKDALSRAEDIEDMNKMGKVCICISFGSRMILLFWGLGKKRKKGL